MTAHYVYRIYDADDRLIYVGCTGNLFQRLRFHHYGYTAWWNDQAVKTIAKVYRSENEARAAEKAAIREGRPRWNISGKWCTNANWTKAEFEDFVTALLNSPEFGQGTLRRARRVAAVYRTRTRRELDIDWASASRVAEERFNAAVATCRDRVSAFTETGA